MIGGGIDDERAELSVGGSRVKVMSTVFNGFEENYAYPGIPNLKSPIRGGGKVRGTPLLLIVFVRGTLAMFPGPAIGTLRARFL